MASRPGRRSKRLLSISEEHSQDENKRSQLSNEKATEIGRNASVSSSNILPSLSPSEIKPQPTYNPDIRKSVPYFLPPPPPPAFLNNDIPAVPVYDPYIRFAPFPAQYPQQFQRQGQQQTPIPMMPPRPFPPVPFQQNQDANTVHQVQLTSNKNSGALNALAELSESVGKNLTSKEVKSINKTLLTQQYQKALAVTSKLFQFIKNVLNGSELSENIESVSYEQVNENFEAAKALAEILGDWKDMLESEENYNEDLTFHLTGAGSVVFGLDDPNIQLVLPPYQPMERDRKKKMDLADTPLDNIQNLNLKHKKLVYGMCDQCEVEETIQWRRGPNGERSLCNACGLFYTKLIRKLGQELAGQLLAQRKFAGFASDRRIPPALLAEDIIHYYIVEELDTGKRQEVNVKDLGKLDCFDNSVDPPRLTKKLVLMPLVERLAEVVLDVTNMNSKYDPSHEINILKERKNEESLRLAATTVPTESEAPETFQNST